MANKRQFLKKNIYLVTVTLLLLVTVICVVNLNAFSEEIDGDHIIIDGKAYRITDDTKSLVDADLALIEWNAQGNSTEDADSMDRITGVIDNQPISGYWAAYQAVYGQLLGKATSSFKKGSTVSSTIDTDSIDIYRFYKDANATDIQISISASRAVNGTLIMLVDNRVEYEKAVLKATSSFTVNSGGKLIIQGPDPNKKLTIQGNGKDSKDARGSSLLNVKNGSLYLINCEITDYNFGGYHAINLSKGNYARYLYMANSTMSHLKGTEAGGIFCSVYGEDNDNTYAQQSRLYLHDSYFYKCSTSEGATRGGSAIRSYAADRCVMQVKKCTFEENTCSAIGQSSGGGAVYWKSAEGSATFIDCQFINNTAAKVGGAIYNTGRMNIQKCIFRGNKATGTAEGQGCGGAIAVEPPYTSSYYAMDYQGLDGSLVLDQDTVLQNNEAYNYGGGIYFNAFSSQIGSAANNGTQIEKFVMTLEIDGATIENNKAKYGGAIAMWLNYDQRNYATGITIDADSKILNNHATVDGGAIWMSSAESCWCKYTELNEETGEPEEKISSVTLESGALIDNHADNRGGAIFIATGSTTAVMNFNFNNGIAQNNWAQNQGGASFVQGGNLTMLDGEILDCYTKDSQGGAIFLSSGNFNLSGGTIQNCEAQSGNGGAVYVSGGNATMTGGDMLSNKATENGGAVCVNGGSFVMSGGTIEGDSNPNNVDAQFGGAVYVSGGNATITGGTLLANKAEQNGGAICIEGGSFTISGGMIQGDNNHALADAQLGGAVYVSGGNAHVNGGTLSGCSANSGGAIYVNGGTVTMLGGSITGNKATAGNGGAIYVTGTTDLNVTVQSGEISGNSASANGGAICVQGVDESTNTITVQIGVNELHYTVDGTLKDCDHNGDALDGLGFCPIVKDNVCDSEGGAIYIVGTKQTQLNIYCIKELGNRGAGNVAGSTETSLSDFLKVDGGTVLISATDAGGGVYYGDSRINSSIHVTGGDLTLSGTLTNPAIFAPITVDVVAKGGSYTDARTNDKREGAEQYYVIKYFENFKVGEGDNVQATGRYTVHQALITEPHTIWGIIYSYTGYTIVGWNTVDDGTGTTFEVSSKIEYEDFKVYMKGIALELYAIWSKDYYWIQFEPNADVFSGTMGNGDRRISFDCAEPTLLPVIGYVNLGYRFLGWHTDPDAIEAKYTNNQTIAALSQTFGEIIKLYAIWIECDHSNDEWHAYTGADNTITCTCACSYFVTVTLVAPKNAVYDGLPHPAQPIFTNNSNDEFNENIAFVNWAITYSYTPFEVGYTTDKVVTDAGNYTATLTYEGFTAKIDFTISKATQNAPAIPTFTTGKLDDDRGYLLVDQTETIDAEINYVLEYTTKDENGQATQHRIQPDDTYTEGIRFNDFDASWTLYYVVAWYSGNNNYEESVHVKSKQTYIYKGDISIVIIDAPNMQTSIVEDAENDRVSLVSGILHKDWYISSAYSASASGTLTKTDYADIVMENVFSNYFERSVTVVDGKTQFAYIIKNAFDDGYSGTITISFTGVKQAPIVSVSVAPNEVFGDVTDTNTEISADSAFTAYFEIAYFVDGVYASPVLRFGTDLPSGTTIILVDKSNGSYWYKTIETSTSTVAITELVPMRGTGTLSAESKLLKYQLIVDFSDVATPLSAGVFSVSLSYTEKTDDYAPEINVEKSITLKKITNSVGAPAVTVNSATVSICYAEGGEASKWTEKELSLVLIPENLAALPIDASVLVEQTVGEQIKTTLCERNPNGAFIVVLDPDVTFIKITLQSQMFKTEADYVFGMQIYSAYAGSAPMNGIAIRQTQTLTLHAPVAAQNAIKIEVIDHQVVYTYDDTINARIFASVGTGYKATVTLLRKNSDGKYESTGWSQEWKPDNETSNYQTIRIENIGESFGEGIYCLSVVVRDGNTSTAVMTVPYYLIIQK